ncbi:MAG: hypothetical protein LC772_03665 [Chloroflexi bacterium]|nr:hypothetical protein [Chloroflexota bacterium]
MRSADDYEWKLVIPVEKLDTPVIVDIGNLDGSGPALYDTALQILRGVRFQKSAT